MSSEHPIGLKTLKDVRLVLPAIYSKASAKTLAAALGKVEKLTGKKLSQLPADENAWYQASRSIIWAGAFRGLTPGDQEEAFETWVKKIAAIIRRAHAHVAVPVIVADESRAWDQIVQYATDVENTVDDQGALILPNMFSMSMTNLRNRYRSVHPSELTTETAHQALASCRADTPMVFERLDRHFFPPDDDHRREIAIPIGAQGAAAEPEPIGTVQRRLQHDTGHLVIREIVKLVPDILVCIFGLACSAYCPQLNAISASTLRPGP